MYSKLKPFAFMGVSNSEMFLSEKDPTSTMEISLLVTRRQPPLELQEEEEEDQLCSEDDNKPADQQKQEEEEEEDKCKLMMMMMAPMEIKLPSSRTELLMKLVDENKEDGLKTPTSLDHKIPAILKCPPAPRKPKSLPISTKRKGFGRSILLDLAKEVESLFPPALLADLGNKIKKVRQGSDHFE